MECRHVISLGGADSDGCSHNKVISFFGQTDFIDLPVSVKNHCALRLGERVFCIGGQEDGSEDYVGSRRVWAMSDKVFVDDFIFNWNEKAPMNIGRTQFGGVVYRMHSEEVIIVAGGRGEAAATAEYYSPVMKKWEPLPQLNIPRYGHALVNSEGLVYALGGKDLDGTVIDKIEVFMGGEWLIIPTTMKIPRYLFAAVNHREDIYAIGGWNDNATALQSVETVFGKREYFMKTARCKHAACVFDDKITVIGGHTDKVDEHHRWKVVKTIEQLVDDNWIEVNQTNEELFRHAIVPI